MAFISRLLSSSKPERVTDTMMTPPPTQEPQRASGARLMLSSTEERTSLLELYTSEGCSSCPPAETWFRTLRTRDDLWKRFVPVAFHVDYWNRLGWVDSLSTAANTTRQHRYASEWNTTSVYTPEFVLSGREWRRPSKLASYSNAAFDTGSSRVGKLTAQQTESRQFEITFTPLSDYSKLRVTAALLGSGVEHKVTAGENRGERLIQEFAALSIVEVVMVQKKRGTWTATVEWPMSNQSGARSLSVAIWVSSTDSQLPIQSVGGDLL